MRPFSIFPFDIPRTLAVFAFMCCVSTAAEAQISLAWPAPTVDVGKYKTVFECLAATERVRRAPERLVLRDTLPADSTEVLEAVPREVIAVAQECSARYTAANVPLSQLKQWIQLFLLAQRDTEARALWDRRVATIRMGDTAAMRERGRLLELLATLYIQARPTRLELARPVIAELQQITSIRWMNRFKSADLFRKTAYRAGDSLNTRQAARWLESIADHMTEAERSENSYKVVASDFLDAIQYLTRAAALDSLRKATSAYLAMQRALRTRLNITDPRIGLPGLPLEGDFWFPGEPTVRPPVPGRVTLVVGTFTQQLARAHGVAAMLRRLKSRFPELDIVLFTQTVGSFGPAKPPTPTEEAEFRRRQLQDFYRIPATVVVTSTPFWHLPDPDRRRINEPISNVLNYGDRISLLDQDGIIVHQDLASKDAEPNLAILINVLLHRTGTTPHAVARQSSASQASAISETVISGHLPR